MEGLIIVAQVVLAIAYGGLAWMDRPRPEPEATRART